MVVLLREAIQTVSESQVEAGKISLLMAFLTAEFSVSVRPKASLSVELGLLARWKPGNTCLLKMVQLVIYSVDLQGKGRNKKEIILFANINPC